MVNKLNKIVFVVVVVDKAYDLRLEQVISTHFIIIIIIIEIGQRRQMRYDMTDAMRTNALLRECKMTFE